MNRSIRPKAHDEEGSIILAMLVIFIATALVVTCSVVIVNSLRVSRRSGDSANALQLADAAVNEAVKAVATATTNTLSSPVVDVPADGGSFRYTAVLDSVTNVWHIDARGTDRTGVERRVLADAVPEPLVGSAYFAHSNVTFPSGTSLDSFQNGSSVQKMCTRKGFLGSNDLTIDWPTSGSGVGVRNCTQATYGVSWEHPMDGCTFYAGDTGDPPPVVGASNIGSGKCPPAPATTGRSPQFQIPDAPAPAGVPSNGSDTGNFIPATTGPGPSQPAVPNVCDATHPLNGRSTPYYWSNVNLLEGCVMNVTTGPIIIVTEGDVIIGDQNGNAGVVNPPTTDPAICPAYTALLDVFNDPNSYYCPGWSSKLQIYVKNAGNVRFGNHAKFWGVVIGSQATVTGGPQATIWGALLTGGTTTSAQFTMHYDEALGDITTGRYLVANWREESLAAP